MVSYVLEDTELQQRIKSALRLLAMGDTWLTPAEAAARARISKSHFLRLMRVANGPKYCGQGRLMRFRVSDIDAWITAGFHNSDGNPGVRGHAAVSNETCATVQPGRLGSTRGNE